MKRDTKINKDKNFNKAIKSGKKVDFAFKAKTKKTNNDDRSPEYKKFLKRKKIRKATIISVQILLLFVIFGGWEALAHFGLIDTFIMSSPSKIVQTFVELWQTGDIMYHVNVTLNEALIAFLISTIVGTIIAIILWWNDFLQKTLNPYIVVLNSLPKVALGPIIIIWVGIGTSAIVVMAVLIMIIITILSMLHAFNATDPNKVLLLQSMNATKFQILYKLVLPSALPEFMSVLKINVGLTWVGTIMGEYLVSRAGLGHLIIYGGQTFKLSLVMTSTVILCVLAALMYFLVAFIEKKVVKTVFK